MLIVLLRIFTMEEPGSRVAELRQEVDHADDKFQRYHYTAPDKGWKGPSAECGEHPSFDTYFNQSSLKRSRAMEDKMLYDALFRTDGKTVKGNYIELGAFDGESQSNTRFFELCLGWKGLLIEGNPSSFKKLVGNRPGAHRMSFAPSCSADVAANNGTVRFTAGSFTSAGLSEFVEARNQVSVPCGPLAPVLEHVFQEEPIDFFSLDVEGAELLVLDTVDFHAARIEVLMVESWNRQCKRACPKRDSVRTKMKGLGYQLFENMVRLSDVFVHPKFQYQPVIT